MKLLGTPEQEWDLNAVVLHILQHAPVPLLSGQIRWSTRNRPDLCFRPRSHAGDGSVWSVTCGRAVEIVSTFEYTNLGDSS